MPLLPEREMAFLEEKFKYDLAKRGNEVYLVLNDWKLTDAYVPDRANVLIIVPPSYPMAALDMFYTSPPVRLRSGGWPVTADVLQSLSDGTTWQRWSRHITWRPNIDNLRTFITAVRAEIDKGI
jgi:hypothetical protein